MGGETAVSGRVLLYGANGYTGSLVAQHLAQELDLVLAGRNAEALRALAEPLGLEWRCFDLSSPALIGSMLADISVVLHAAGPFAQTALPMAQACLATGTHYLDFSGEWPVFQALTELDQAAQAAGVMLLPGIGLTVATSDCLLARAVELWPDTTKLCLGISHPQIISRGSAGTMAGMFAAEAPIRRGGRLVNVPAGSLARSFDFSAGLRDAVAISWADIVTGEITTGVRDIEVYSEVHWAERAMFRMGGLSMGLFGSGLAREVAGAMARTWGRDPDADERAAAHYTMVVEAIDPWRRVRRLSMVTRDGYGASVMTAAEALRRVLAGQVLPGFQIPARVFGSRFAVAADAARFGPEEARSAA